MPRVLAEEPDCRLAYPGTWWTSRGPATCAGVSQEVDHIGDPADHSRPNLRGVCRPCHARRTSDQAAGRT